MKKIFLIPILQLISTALYSSTNTHCRINELERQIEQVRIVTPKETYGANIALARPILDVEYGCCGSNFFVEASVLHWHPKVTGTEFVSGVFITEEIEVDNNEFEIGSIKNCLQSVDLCWNSGFKVGIGSNLPCDGWDIFLYYTGFSSSGHKSICARKNNEYLINYKSFPLTEIPIEFSGSQEIFLTNLLSKKAKSNFYLDLNALEFELGRSFYISKSLVLHPKIGLKAFWIELRQNTHYLSVQTTEFILLDTPLRDLLFPYVIKDSSKFSSVGPKLAFGTEWHFCNNFYLYGDISGLLLYGSFTTDHREQLVLIQQDDEGVERREFKHKNCICQSRRAFVPIVDMKIGIAYDTYCNCDRMHLTLRLAFDAQYIWRINQILETRYTTLNYSRISEDMSIQGVTFDIRLDF